MGKLFIELFHNGDPTTWDFNMGAVVQVLEDVVGARINPWISHGHPRKQLSVGQGWVHGHPVPHVQRKGGTTLIELQQS